MFGCIKGISEYLFFVSLFGYNRAWSAPMLFSCAIVPHVKLNHVPERRLARVSDD